METRWYKLGNRGLYNKLLKSGYHGKYGVISSCTSITRRDEIVTIYDRQATLAYLLNRPQITRALLVIINYGF